VRIRDGGSELEGRWFKEHVSKRVGDGSIFCSRLIPGW
jgi:hypothetical protein